MEDKFSLTYGAAGEAGALYLCGVVNDLEDQDVYHTIIWERLGSEWKRYTLKNRTYGMTAFAANGVRAVAYMHLDGHIRVRNDQGVSVEEIVDQDPDSPSRLRTLTTIRVIGEHVYAAGMRRMVYRRQLRAGPWARFDRSVRLPLKDTAIAGFNSIDGFSEDDLYAVGLGGELWWCRSSAWTQIDSPTNLRLEAIRCSGEFALVGGAGGTLLVGAGHQWSTVSHDATQETFSCIETGFGRWFLVGDSGKTYELILNPHMELREFAAPLIGPSSWIAPSPAGLLFVSAASAKLYDGQNWTDVTPQ